MRILIDLQACQSGSRNGGIGRYSMSLAKAMLRLNTKHKICLLLNTRLPNENVIRAEFAGLMSQQDILSFDVPAYVAADNNLPAHTRLAELIREKRIAEINPDVLHIASLFEGAGEDVVSSIGLLFPAERTAVTLYDLIPYLEQETYLGTKILADHYLGKFDALKRAGMIVSISAFSRVEALEITDIPAEKIVNISSAVDGQFAPTQVDENARALLFRKSGITKPFLMFTGSFDVRKNHERLVKAFARVPANLRGKYQLLIVGKGAERQIASLKAVAVRHGLNEKDLVFVGHVTDADLVALYNLCTLFVFPSLREGFGLPALEAMSCGVPTIGSNRTSIPEVIAHADALFDPENIDDIAAKIASVLGDDTFREELRRHGLKQSRNFSWALSAKRAIAFFEQQFQSAHNAANPLANTVAKPSDIGQANTLYESFLEAFARLNLGKLDDDFLESAARVIARNELRARLGSGGFHSGLRIGWVTPWGMACEISAYSRRMISLLQLQPTIFAPFLNDGQNDKETGVISCWKSGVDDVSNLRTSLASVALDVVLFQYADDVFNLTSLATLILDQVKLGRSTFVTLHSTENLLELTAENGMFKIRSALKSCAGNFVHSTTDIKNLASLGIIRNVHFLPIFGTPSARDKSANDDEDFLIADYFLKFIAFDTSAIETPPD